MGCISSAPVEPEGDEFEGDPLADLKRRKRDLEQEVKGAQEYGQALLASQAELLKRRAEGTRSKNTTGARLFVAGRRSLSTKMVRRRSYGGRRARAEVYKARHSHGLQGDCGGLQGHGV